MAETVWLERPGNDIPWGFRLHGGCDFHVPLTVQKVTAGSVAATGLNAGDVITSIGGAETASLTHAQAMQTIKDSGNSLQLTVSRSGVGSPVAAAVYPTAVTSPPVLQAQSPPRFDIRQQPQQQQQPFATNYSDTGYSSVGSPMQMSEYPFAGDSTYQNSYTNGGGPPSMTTSTSDLYDSMLSNPDYYDSTLPSSQEPSVGGRQPSGRAVAQSPQPQMPDKVINMASRVGKDKKPFAYVADVNDIQAQRERVRKKNPVCTLPRYQHMLNMPQFEDPIPARIARSVPSSPAVQGPGTPSDTAVVSNLQFNSPLGMYSGDNVVEALTGQTGGQISSVVGLPQKDKGDITQSAVYKMIHGIDQPRPRAPAGPAAARSPPPKEPSATDEVKFSGFNRGEIPSKSFQRLQSWTGTTGGGQSEIDTTSIRHVVTGGDGQDEPGQYDEKSIRYTGRNIPSRSFRMLQSMTGGEGSTGSPAREIGSDDEARRGGMRSRSETPSRLVQRPAAQHPHHPHHPQHPQHPHQQFQPQPVHTGGSEIDTTSFRHNLLGDDSQPEAADYDQSSIRYTGNKIPSRSFRMLQQMTGGDSATPPVPSQLIRRQPNSAQQPRRIRTAPPNAPSPAPAADDSHQQQQQGGDQQPAADIRYVGGHIPSQSFRILQQSVGADGEQQPQPAPTAELATTNGTSDMMQSSQGHKVKVVRLRSQASVEEKSGATEF